MNKYLRIAGILSVLCFSFYFTEQAALFMRSQDPLYESIVAVKEEYKEESINAIIKDDYMIPGYSGIEINVDKSFQNMKYLGYYQTVSLVFDEIKPEVSVSENKDKIIYRGNSLKQSVALILEDEHLIAYLEEMGIPYSVLTTQENVDTHRAYGTKINNDFTNYDAVEKALKNNKENNELCYIKNNNKDFCIEKKKLLIKETLSVSKNDFSKTYNKVSSGDIIYIQNNLGLANFKVLLENIEFKGLKIISLQDLISESRE